MRILTGGHDHDQENVRELRKKIGLDNVVDTPAILQRAIVVTDEIITEATITHTISNTMRNRKRKRSRIEVNRLGEANPKKLEIYVSTRLRAMAARLRKFLQMCQLKLVPVCLTKLTLEMATLT